MPVLALTLLLIAVFFGGLMALGLVLHWIFDRLAGNPKKSVEFAVPRFNSAPKTPAVQATNPPAATTQAAAAASVATLREGEAAYRERMKALGMTVEVGDELRMGWFEMIFKAGASHCGH